MEETPLVLKGSADRQARASRGEGMAVSRVAPRSIVCTIWMHGLAAILLLIAFTACDCRPSSPHLTLATTTSVGNSGLLDQLMPAFAREQGSDIRPRLVPFGVELRKVLFRFQYLQPVELGSWGAAVRQLEGLIDEKQPGGASRARAKSGQWRGARSPA